MLKRIAGIWWMVVLAVVLSLPGNAQMEQAILGKSMRASLIFERSPEDPTFLNIFLHVVNVSNGDLMWTADPVAGIEAKLFDPDGKPAALPSGGMVMDLLSASRSFTLPPGSRLDLLISHNWGISTSTNPAGTDVVELGDHIWYVPADQLGSYRLHVQLIGMVGAPQKRPTGFPAEDRKLLLDLPPQKIVISPASKG